MDQQFCLMGDFNILLLLDNIAKHLLGTRSYIKPHICSDSFLLGSVYSDGTQILSFREYT